MLRCEATRYGLLGTAELDRHNPEVFIRVLLEPIADHSINRINEQLLSNLQATHTKVRTGDDAMPNWPRRQ